MVHVKREFPACDSSRDSVLATNTRSRTSTASECTKQVRNCDGPPNLMEVPRKSMVQHLTEICNGVCTMSKGQTDFSTPEFYGCTQHSSDKSLVTLSRKIPHWIRRCAQMHRAPASMPTISDSSGVKMGGAKVRRVGLYFSWRTPLHTLGGDSPSSA
jgi:hypothetical protein